MKQVGISLREPGNEIEALKSTARSIREGYGAGTLIKVGADQFHSDSDWVGFWTAYPETWVGEFTIDILIESDVELGNYEMAQLVEAKIKDYE